MDEQLARQTDLELKELMDQFICVRLVQMGGVDLSVFQFDPFLSWSVFFMNGDRTIYGRFGTASPETKLAKIDSNPNHSLAGMKAALKKALEIHRAYSNDPDTYARVLAAKTGPAPRWKTAESTPSARKYKRMGRVKDGSPGNCLHCHEVQRMAIDSFFMTETRVPDNMLWVYPSPEALGLVLSKDHAARVVRVIDSSLAARAGLQAGDDIVTMNGQPLVSIADVQWVLHWFPDKGGPIALEVLRGEESHTMTITLPDLWRRHDDFGWRYRVAGYAAWLWSGATLADHPQGIRVSALSPGWFKKPNRSARDALRRGDIIVAVDGQTGMTRSLYIAYLMRDKALASEVKLRVRRGAKTIDVTFRIPATQPEVQGH